MGDACTSTPLTPTVFDSLRSRVATGPQPTNSVQAPLPDSQGARLAQRMGAGTNGVVLTAEWRSSRHDHSALMLPTSTRTPRPMVEDTATFFR